MLRVLFRLTRADEAGFEAAFGDVYESSMAEQACRSRVTPVTNRPLAPASRTAAYDFGAIC